MIKIDLVHDAELFERLRTQRQKSGRRNLTTELAQYFPTRLIEHLSQAFDLTGNLADWSDARLGRLCDQLSAWELAFGKVRCNGIANRSQ